MGSSYVSLHYHLVFSTKGRRPLIDSHWRPLLHEYLGGTVRGLRGDPPSIGGVEDHVHLLVSLDANHKIKDFLRELKKASSVWAMHRHCPLSLGRKVGVPAAVGRLRSIGHHGDGLLSWPSLTAEEETRVNAFLSSVIVCDLTPDFRFLSFLRT